MGASSPGSIGIRQGGTEAPELNGTSIERTKLFFDGIAMKVEVKANSPQAQPSLVPTFLFLFTLGAPLLPLYLTSVVH